MSTALNVLVPLYIYNQNFIEYYSTVNVTVISDGISKVASNPHYDTSLFTAYIPVFKGLVEPENVEHEEDEKPYHALFNAYYTVANQKLDYNKYGADWYLLMSYFIAHNMQLRFQEMASQVEGAVASVEELGSISQGVMTAGKAGDVSYTINNLLTDKMFNDAGEYNYTRFGKMFWSIYKRYANLLSKGLY